MNSERDDNRSERHEHDVVMPPMLTALADLLIKLRRGEAGYDQAAKFLDETTEAPPPGGV